jgi:hypothetical protein
MSKIEQGALAIRNLLYECLTEKKGCVIGRWGTIEFETLMNRGNPQILERNAGVFPSDKDSVGGWHATYENAVLNADVLATGWYGPIQKEEQNFLKEHEWKGIQVPLRSLEPYYVSPELRWSEVLEDQHICVVSSFTESMIQQVLKGLNKCFYPDSILPENADYAFVRTGYAPVLAQGRCSWTEASDGESITSWQEAVDYVVDRVCMTKARFVLIGCGGLGMIIAHELKNRGKICLVLGGATQILFGIKGKRWENHSFISKLFNWNWISPSADETPGGAQDVEGGCYWM